MAASIVGFPGGLFLSVAVCWNYGRVLRTKLAIYENYIHERLDGQNIARDEKVVHIAEIRKNSASIQTR
jgi:hypothetical protein